MCRVAKLADVLPLQTKVVEWVNDVRDLILSTDLSLTEAAIKSVTQSNLRSQIEFIILSTQDSEIRNIIQRSYQKWHTKMDLTCLYIFLSFTSRILSSENTSDKEQLFSDYSIDEVLASCYHSCQDLDQPVTYEFENSIIMSRRDIEEHVFSYLTETQFNLVMARIISKLSLEINSDSSTALSTSESWIKCFDDIIHLVNKFSSNKTNSESLIHKCFESLSLIQIDAWKRWLDEINQKYFNILNSSSGIEKWFDFDILFIQTVDVIHRICTSSTVSKLLHKYLNSNLELCYVMISCLHAFHKLCHEVISMPLRYSVLDSAGLERCEKCYTDTNTDLAFVLEASNYNLDILIYQIEDNYAALNKDDATLQSDFTSDILIDRLRIYFRQIDGENKNYSGNNTSVFKSNAYKQISIQSEAVILQLDHPLVMVGDARQNFPVYYIKQNEGNYYILVQ
jgi:hypothetical protein